MNASSLLFEKIFFELWSTAAASSATFLRLRFPSVIYYFGKKAEGCETRDFIKTRENFISSSNMDFR